MFVDGTPGDGSRTVYSDMVRFGFNVSEESRLDFFALYNEDDNILRWGTDRGKHRSMTGLGGGAEPEMDDWGYGVVWVRAWPNGFPTSFLRWRSSPTRFTGRTPPEWR